MAYFDVFNGDADGICALQQLRLSQPRDSVLVTGVKRDINLLKKVEATAGDELTVLDISMAKNTADLQRLLDAGAKVLYFDHHQAGEIPQHPGLDATINTSAEVCTSLLVNAYLKNAHSQWAVVGAFGDNLDKSATAAAKPLNLAEAELAQLKELGICLNYNGYGVTLDDLYFAPDVLFRHVQSHESPFDFLQTEVFQTLTEGYKADMSKARQTKAELDLAHAAVFILPAESWANRVSGVFGNELAQMAPDRAHAMVTPLDNGDLRISVRAPLNRREGADVLCSSFPTGGGRKAAAGINALPKAMYEDFVKKFSEMYQ